MQLLFWVAKKKLTAIFFISSSFFCFAPHIFSSYLFICRILKRKVKFLRRVFFLYALQGQCKLVQLFSALHTSQNNQVQMMSSQMALLSVRVYYKKRYIYFQVIVLSWLFVSKND